MSVEKQIFGELGKEEVLRKEVKHKHPDVMCINKHGRRVGVTYDFYMNHGRHTGLELVEDQTKFGKPESQDVKVSRPKDIPSENTITKLKQDVLESIDDVKPAGNAAELSTSNGYLCSVCGKVCKTQDGLNIHLKKHEKEAQIQKTK